MSDGADQIRAERGRQIVTEDYSVEHDLTAGGAMPLVSAAVSYVATAHLTLRGTPIPDGPPLTWPWSDQAFKPTGDAKRDLVKAGALIAAAIDQIDLERRNPMDVADAEQETRDRMYDTPEES